MTIRINGAEMYLYGAVGADLFEDGFSAAEVIDALVQIGEEDIVVHLNSGGGIATEGVAIYTALRSHPGLVTVIIEGVAASAASIVAIAGDEVIITTGSVMMIHDPSTMTFGNAAAHSQVRDALDKLGAAYSEVYAEKTGKLPEEMRDLMRAETWMTASEAVELGFADAVEHFALATEDEPKFAPTAFAYAAYARAPQAFLALAKANGWNTRAIKPAAPAAPIEEMKLASKATSGRKRTLTATQRAQIVASVTNPKLRTLLANSKIVLETLTEEDEDLDEAKTAQEQNENTEEKTEEITAEVPAEEEEKAEAPVAETETDKDETEEPEVPAEETKEEVPTKEEETKEEETKTDEDEEAEKARAEGIRKTVAAVSRQFKMIKASDADDFITAGFSVSQVTALVHAKIVAEQSPEVVAQSSRSLTDTNDVWARVRAKAQSNFK